MTADYAILEVDIADHFGSYKCEANSDFQDSAVVDETFVKVTREFGDGKYKLFRKNRLFLGGFCLFTFFPSFPVRIPEKMSF